MMSNGYKPAPLDLSDVKLSPSQEVLVDKLAENAHNVWAKDRIRQGWTYGIQQVFILRNILKSVWQHNPMDYTASAQQGCTDAVHLALMWGSNRHPCVVAKAMGVLDRCSTSRCKGGV